LGARWTAKIDRFVFGELLPEVLDGVDVGLADVVCLVVFGVVEKVVDGQAAEDVLGAEEFGLELLVCVSVSASGGGNGEYLVEEKHLQVDACRDVHVEVD